MKQVIKNIRLADRLLFLFLIGGALAGIFISREAVSQSPDVLVEVDGRPAYTFPVTVDKEVTVKGKSGEAVIEIKDKRVRISEAHCPNQICVKQGWVSRGVIVCLPNRIVVIVGGKGRSDKNIDAVTG